MRYFVIGEDGQKYGPADIPTLNSWITEGRLLATQQLEDEASGLHLAASAVQGLNFPLPAVPPTAASEQPPASGGQPYEQYYARPDMRGVDYGQKELTTSWVLFGIGFPFCLGLLLWPIGIYFANKAEQLGNPGARAAKIANIVMTCLSWIGFVLYIILVAMAVATFGTGVTRMR